jgi:hypothetical protein
MALTQVASGLIASVSGASLTGTQTIPKSTLPTGCVLQVVQGTLSSSVSTTTLYTFVTTGLAASITPSSSTSKILTTVSGFGYTSASAVQGVFTLYRNSTNLLTYGSTLVYTFGANSQAGITFSYLDSPATTSSTTYTLYFSLANSAGTVTFNSPSAWGQPTATIISQEIAA